MEVRTVDAADRELCAALGEIVVRAYRALPEPPADIDFYLRELADVAGRAAAPDTEVLGAFDGDGRPVACVTYVAAHTSPLAELQVEGESGIRMLGVDLRGYRLPL